jgi:hypothetical protein
LVLRCSWKACHGSTAFSHKWRRSGPSRRPSADVGRLYKQSYRARRRCVYRREPTMSCDYGTMIRISSEVWQGVAGHIRQQIQGLAAGFDRASRFSTRVVFSSFQAK